MAPINSILVTILVVVSIFVQQCIAEEIICSTNNLKCTLGGPVNVIAIGPLPPQVVSFTWKDEPSATTFLWKMNPSSDLNMLKGFQMSILGIGDKTNGFNEVISFKVQDVNMNDTFRFDNNLSIPGEYKISIYPMPTDSNLSNKLEKDIAVLGSQDITDTYLLDSAELKMDGRPRNDLMIENTPVVNPFTSTLITPQVSTGLRPRIKGYEVFVSCVLAKDQRYYYGVFSTRVEPDPSYVGNIILKPNNTLVPGYYDFRITPYMDTKLNQCRKVDNTEQPCKSIVKAFPIAHYVCIPNGNFSMKCHEMMPGAVASNDRYSFVWAIEPDVTPGAYDFSTELSSQDALPRTRRVFSCEKRDKKVEKCEDLQDKLESCCIIPDKCKIVYAPPTTTTPTIPDDGFQGFHWPIALAIVAAVLVAFTVGVVIYVSYGQRCRKISLLVLDFRKFHISGDPTREISIRNVRINIVDLGDERPFEVHKLLKRSDKVMCLFSSEAHYQEYMEKRLDHQAANIFYHVINNLRRRTFIATFDYARTEQPELRNGKIMNRGNDPMHVYHLPQEYNDLLKSVNPRLARPEHFANVSDKITRYKPVYDPSIYVTLDPDLLYLIANSEQPDWSCER